jgi:glucosyl-3-phosphoglycerate synthase
VADFYQTGVVATLHRLHQRGLDALEDELATWSESRPIGLVLPALYSEFKTPAMAQITAELAQVPYLKRIVVAVGRATESEYRHACTFFRGMKAPVTVLWVDSPEVQGLFADLEARGLSAGQDGKGRSCWLAYGYLLACNDCEVIALHDCDILNYNRELLARLCYPVTNANLGFEFCKGFYARVTDRMHGRVTRLFLTPLIRAMDSLIPGAPFLRFVDSFRYALAGEFAMRTNLARVNRIPGDWGLKVGVLAEVLRNCSAARVCQVDLTDNYEHKHQDLSAEDPSRGLRRMAADVAKSVFRTLAGEGHVFTQDAFRTLQVRYVRMTEDTIHRYYADAMLNGLEFDRHAEERAVATFAKSLCLASEEFLEHPLGLPLIPNWNRVVAAMPDVFERLRLSVEASEPTVVTVAA